MSPRKKAAPPVESATPAQPATPVVEPVPPPAEFPPPSPAYVTPVAPPPPPSFSQTVDKPGMVQAVAIMTLVNGILNILWGSGATLGMIAGIATICLVPVTILPLILGIFEILYAVKLMSNPPQPVRPSQAIAIMEICCILVGNVISLVIGILALVFYNDPAVKAYFARINGQA